ncbi:MAG: MOSC domain-containing protein [Dehalococcoidia bacterium]|nr:MAG: MOSC domain-containing protein [bacterium]MCE7928335.1 MOSC domain-containing protein [Chloroflexi bacterium CFX7]MCK6563226.1 MOSC domain-containing protein [Dehalococcoidia bacterium]MCL4232818.1 MOSC domain-containing protein [Dehalococcoidia bacterium]NUQ56179.1 MOSC domain-containing protein [Dehalococcoidia bacterium]
MAGQATIAQINVSGGGVPKKPVPLAVVGELGIAGDYQADSRSHGGVERALCLYAEEVIEAVRAEGHPITPGSAGENITTRGLEWSLVQPGAHFRLGAEVLIEITRFTTPCKTIRGSFEGGDFNRIHHKLHPGWSRAYARVLEGGVIRPGDAVELVRAGALAGP